MENKNNRVLIYFFLVFSSVIIIRNAWIGDDAYIAFRTVYNFVNGFGLTFNINERVQSFTNPLWVLVMSFFYLFTKEVYFTSIFLCLFLTVASLYIITVRLNAENYLTIIIVFSAALASKAFIDYSTAGLENALSYFFIALFYYVYLSKQSSDKKILLLSLIASFAAVNRLDNVLLYFFPILFEFVKSFSFKTIVKIIIGLIPLIVWELFAIIYYGFFLPNTYYTKLNTGIPSTEIIDQGIGYLLNSFNVDPITLLFIFLTSFISIDQVRRLKKYNLIPITLSIILYVFYTVKVGGDFMSGRFLTYPFTISLVLISQFDIPKPSQYVTIACCLALGFFTPFSPILSNGYYRAADKRDYDKITTNNGVGDTRAYWYPNTGLLLLSPDNWGLVCEKKLKSAPKNGIISKFAETPVGLGFNTYETGPDTYFFHHMGLSDVLIARLPMDKENEANKRWVPGHIWRKIPDGYLETLMYNKNYLTNKYLSDYYNKIELIIRGKLFTWDRFKTIYEMNTGKYNYLIDSFMVSSAAPYHKYTMHSLQSANKTIVYDSSAYIDSVRCVSPGTILTYDNICYGPYITLPKGNYKINFSLKVDSNNDSLEVVYIDAFNEGTIFAQKTITANEFKEPLKYEVFTLNIAPETDLRNAEFRIFYKRHHNVCTDYIEVVPLK